MPETQKPQPASEQKCMMCQCGSHDRPLIFLVYRGKEDWVCAGCLPMLIHGQH